MAKKKRIRQDKPSSILAEPFGGPVALESRPEPASAARLAVPAEAGGSGTVAIFALIMFLAPALGVPHEEMLQDTLKSIVVAFAALGAALLFFWQQRDRREALRWHAVIWLPLLLMTYALGSMAWSHTYLAGTET